MKNNDRGSKIRSGKKGNFDRKPNAGSAFDGRKRGQTNDDRRKASGKNAAKAFDGEEKPQRNDLIIGRNPVTEVLKSGRPTEKVIIQKGATGSIGKIIDLAEENGIQIEYSSKLDLDRLCGSSAHQGCVAIASAHEYAEMEDIFAKADENGEEPFIIILDEIEDPHNLGAIMRTAECSGASGIIIPKKRSVGLNETVAKTSAGAIEYMPVVKVTNLSRTIDELKEQGFWIAACDMDGVNYTTQDLTGKMAVVVGSEGRGVSRLVKEKCDFVISMPMKGHINSLNASNAAAIVMYEARRQRDALK